jgi:hypothetical protein
MSIGEELKRLGTCQISSYKTATSTGYLLEVVEGRGLHTLATAASAAKATAHRKETRMLKDTTKNNAASKI